MFKKNINHILFIRKKQRDDMVPYNTYVIQNNIQTQKQSSLMPVYKPFDYYIYMYVHTHTLVNPKRDKQKRISVTGLLL